jgi:predicted transcriptional regulator
MSDDPKLVTLPPAASRALIAFAERIGQNPQELAAEAIERFIAEEEPIAEKVLKAMEEVRAGRSISHEDAIRGFKETIAKAARKRA